jgi:hypothetical protein
MRPFILFIALLVSPPALAATAPLCAIAAAGPMPVADNRRVESTPAQLGKPSRPAASAATHPLPEALASLPFVLHVTAAGAGVIDLGQAHGMLTVAARSETRFMVFEVTPDGQVGIAGAIVELAPAQLETIASGNIIDLGVEHGRVVLALELHPFCALSLLVAFYNALLNFQIRTGRMASWREYLATREPFWPR